jgi:hypothetical protein
MLGGIVQILHCLTPRRTLARETQTGSCKVLGEVGEAAQVAAPAAQPAMKHVPATATILAMRA